MTLRIRGLYRESSFSSSLDSLCLMRRLRSLSAGPYTHAMSRERQRKKISSRSTHPIDSHTQVHKRIHSVHLGPRQSCVLVQPPAVLVRDAFSVLDVQSDDANLVGVTVTDMTKGSRVCFCPWTYMTSRLSRSGTISSTKVFGVLPCAVTPVEQF